MPMISNSSIYPILLQQQKKTIDVRKKKNTWDTFLSLKNHPFLS